MGFSFSFFFKESCCYKRCFQTSSAWWTTGLYVSIFKDTNFYAVTQLFFTLFTSFLPLFSKK